MLSKNQIKFINSLKQKKGRQEHRQFIAEGKKIVQELFDAGYRVDQLFATVSFFDENKLNIPQNTECIKVSPSEMERISALTTPAEVLAVCEVPDNELKWVDLDDSLTLVLDDIRDPGNLGTIIRIADWFGIKNIICSRETVDAFNPKVVQATMGSIARVNLHYEVLSGFFEKLKKNKTILPVYGALLEGKNIYKQKLPRVAIVLIGNESNGISAENLAFITDKITIPAYAKDIKTAESLNAAVATAIICSEFRR